MRTRTIRITGLLAALALLFAACGDDSTDTTVPGTDPTPDPIKLAGTRWVATDMFLGGAPVALVPNAAPTIEFDNDGRSFGGTTGCNLYFGEYTLGTGTIQFGGIGRTEMACEEPLMAQESNVIQVLERASVYNVVEGVLTIGEVGGSALQFVDRATVFPDAELMGTQWIADTIIRGQAASTLVPGTEVTLHVEANALRGFGGCNDYGADIEIDGNQIRVGQITYTEIACMGEGIMQQEAFVFTILGNDFTFEIDGDRLTILDRNGDGLGFQAGT